MYFFEPANPRKHKGNVEWRRENVIEMSAAKKQSFAGYGNFRADGCILIRLLHSFVVRRQASGKGLSFLCHSSFDIRFRRCGGSAFGKRTIASLHLARFIICHPL
jgi:hypothetical protein